MKKRHAAALAGAKTMADVDDGAIVRVPGMTVRVTCRRDWSQTERWCIPLEDDLSEVRHGRIWLGPDTPVLEIIPLHRAAVGGDSIDPVRVR